MSMIKANEGTKGTPSPAPAPASAPAPAPDPADLAGNNASANEADRFKSQAQRPDFIPEKFWKDGAPDVENLAKSYAELTSWKNTKTEELLKQLDAERLKARPEAMDAYKLPEIEGVDPAELDDTPLLGFWRETAFNMGLNQEQFENGIKQYMDSVAASGPDLEAEQKALGENAEQRIAAVTQWATTTFSEPEEFEAIQRLGQTAAGIKVLERLMGQSMQGDSGTGATKSLTIEELKAMQLDARYWNPVHRDPAFVKQVDEGFQKLYAARR